MSTKIKSISALEILDSRGNPTVQTEVELENGVKAKSSVPSGTSTGTYEALELRDKNKNRYGGMGVQKAVDNVNKKIAKLLRGSDVSNQKEIDNKMIKLDGTENKSKLGANAVLSVSLACLKAGALAKNLPLYQYIRETFNLSLTDYKLPIPMFNIFNGGKHADTNLDFQEYMIVPVKNTTFGERLRMGAEVFHELAHVLKERGYDTDVGLEGGYAPDVQSSIEVVEMILKAIKQAGYKAKSDVSLALDVGASSLYDKRKKEYVFKLDGTFLDSHKLIELYREWIKKYPIISIEDGLDEDDWLGWEIMSKEIGNKVQLVGDDLFATNQKKLKEGIKLKIAEAVIIKPNQIGTVTETIEFYKLARENNYKTVVSHRSGETNDDFIADLSVALNSDFIKAGSLSRGERLAKYNRLLEIEKELK